jgi:hypothetical protein
VNEQLLLQEQVLCDDGFAAIRSKQRCDGGEQVKQQVNNILHAVRGQYPSVKAAMANFHISLMN